MISLILFLLIIFLAFVFVFVAFLLTKLIFAIPIFFGAPFVPASLKNVKRMIELANLKPGEIIYDLGSGDGRLIIEAAKNYKAKAVGIEINPLLVYFSRWKIKKLGLQDNISVYQGNFFKKNFSDADVITLYLSQPALKHLEKKFLSELKPGTRIVSLSFTFNNIPFIKAHSEKPNIRLYQIPG